MINNPFSLLNNLSLQLMMIKLQPLSQHNINDVGHPWPTTMFFLQKVGHRFPAGGGKIYGVEV